MLDLGSRLNAYKVIALFPDGREAFARLDQEKSVMVGSAFSCDLQLPCDGVGALHAVLRLCEGEVHVQDYSSELGTFVDGRRVTEERVPANRRIRIGPCDISFRPDDGSATDPTRRELAGPPKETPKQRSNGNAATTWLSQSQSPQRQTTLPSSPRTLEAPPHSLPGAGTDFPSGTHQALREQPQELAEAEAGTGEAEPAAQSSLEGDAGNATQELEVESELVSILKEQLQAAQEESEKLRRQLVTRPAPKREFEIEQDPEDYDSDLLELYRSEIIDLQQELAERDQRIAQLEEGQLDELNCQADLEGLAERVERLLNELQEGDHRILELQEALRLAEEANQAENEERKQLEAWVREVEQRVSQRESEWSATREAMQHQIEELTIERDRAELAASSNEATALQNETIERLRAQLAELTDKFAVSEKQRKAQEQRLAQVNEAARQEEIDRLVREERLGLAEERANLARQLAEVEQSRRNLKAQPDEANQKILVLRQHLREIHRQEIERRQQARDQSLTGRIAKLWKRLDG